MYRNRSNINCVLKENQKERNKKQISLNINSFLFLLKEFRYSIINFSRQKCVGVCEECPFDKTSIFDIVGNVVTVPE